MPIRITDPDIIKTVLEIKESRKTIYTNGFVKNGIHYHVKIFVQGPMTFDQRPADCTWDEIQFPGTFYTVHISHERDQRSFNSTRKYFVRSYKPALELADKMKQDKGIDIIDLTPQNDCGADNFNPLGN